MCIDGQFSKIRSHMSSISYEMIVIAICYHAELCYCVITITNYFFACCNYASTATATIYAYAYCIFVFLAHCPQGCFNGNCESSNICTCNEGWTGSACTTGIMMHTYMCTDCGYVCIYMYVLMYYVHIIIL